jgi:Domain of Unknown Function (DUF1080)/Lectin C-type domain
MLNFYRFKDGIGWNDSNAHFSQTRDNVGFIVEWDSATPAVTTNSAQIPADDLTFGSSRYAYVPGVYSWSEAKSKAAALGGHLATITSAAEDEAILNHLRPKAGVSGIRFWIGGVQQKSGQPWQWITGEAFAYSHWSVGEPDNEAAGGVRAVPPYVIDYMIRSDETGWLDFSETHEENWRKCTTGFLVEWDSASSTAPIATPEESLLGTWNRTSVHTTGPTAGKKVTMEILPGKLARWTIDGEITNGNWTMKDATTVEVRYAGGYTTDMTLSRSSNPMTLIRLRDETKEDGNTARYEKVTQAPMPSTAASPTLWIDSKGRSLQAKFVRVEGSNVLLDIAGKVTPVALASLSADSQKIARDLSPAKAAPADWLVGRWIETMEGQTTTSLADYLPDGSVIFGHSQAEVMGRWVLSGSTLIQFWPANGRDDFTITPAPDFLSAEVTGTTNGKAIHFRMVKSAGVLTGQVPTREELESKSFDFFWKNSADPARSKKESGRILSTGGKVEGVDMEYREWRMRGAKLVVLGKNGEERIHYDTFYKIGDSWIMQGSFFMIKNITHVMRQKVASVAVAAAATTTAPPAAVSGWTPLFPNDSLDLWKGDTSAYRVSGGILKGSGRGDLISPKEYGNFELKFDLRISDEANSGIGIWRDAVTGTTATASHGFEVQIQDDTASKYRSQEFWQRHGGIYFFKPPLSLAMNPPGSWNTHEIRVDGTQVKVTINGRLVQDADLTQLKSQISRAPELDVSRRRGHLLIMGHAGTAEFRNFQIKELP